MQHIGIIGTGLMGRGIALACAQAEKRVTLVKATPGSTESAQQRIDSAYARAIKKGKMTEEAAAAITARIEISGDLDAVADCDFVIESVIEDKQTKLTLFARLADICRADAVIATNTSTLKLADICPTSLVGRFVGLHFFSPAEIMKLVEVATTTTTDPAVKQRSIDFVTSLGKTPVPVDDSTGFIVNRLLVPYLTHAMTAYGRGLARPDHIDDAMKLGCGHPLGPLALSDLIGLDIVYSMSKLLYAEFGDPCYKPPAILRRLVQMGHLGKKSGMGFYDYSQRPAVPNQELWQVVSTGATLLEPEAA